MDPIAKLKNLEERARQRSQERQGQDSMTTPTHVAGAVDKVVPLPLWPEAVRACPSCVLRSALFGVVRRGRRKALERAIIAAWPGITIRYTGFQLDQADLDVWLTALHLARNQKLGTCVEFSIRGFLKALGRAIGKQQKEWLFCSLERMTACAVTLDAEQFSYTGNLIQEFSKDKSTGRYYLVFNPRLATLFEEMTWQEWEIRCNLSMDLAKWLQGYVMSHQATAKNPHRIGLERLRELCGSETGELWKFRQQVKGAMSELQATGVVAVWRITIGDAAEFARSR